MRAKVGSRGLDGLARRLAARALPPAVEAAATRAAAALAQDLAASAGAPAETSGSGARRRVRVNDAAALGRERGTLGAPPAPWLAAALLAFRRRRP
ncbi:hypothetical protein [Xanthobacter sp. KR7-225]|uniref:hypothetical protein n=1 Tax=Xanthobacter sp. KR7-225 TaxID=3156613 RepID=UPI0032B4418B